MKLSTRVRYGARALVELALAHPDRTVSARDIAERQRISPKYLEQILTVLKESGLVAAVRGKRGGYALARPPAAITLKELFESLEGSLAPVHCVDHPDSCPSEAVCPTRETWLEIGGSVAQILERTTLRELAERRRRKAASSAVMYYI
jgi:Rrf2 family protein